jgi:hypothetical protein
VAVAVVLMQELLLVVAALAVAEMVVFQVMQ